MPTNKISKQSGTFGIAGASRPSVAGICVDSDDNRVKYNADGTVRHLATFTDSVETVTATNAITADETGKVFFLSSATEFVSTLPAPAAGLHYTFIVAAAPSSASYTIVTTSSANVILGQVYSSDLDASGNADFETSGCDTITLVDSKAVKGDRVEVYCDGTNWFAYAFCSVFDAITFTTAS